jgi:hypothetical protein
MKKNKFLGTEFGMSMVEIMVAAGLLGGVSLGVMRLMENSTKAAKTIEAKDEISMLTNQINDVLKNPNNCEATFGSKKEGDSISMVYQVLGGTSVPKFSATTSAGPEVQIESMNLKDVDDNGSNGSAAVATFEVVFKKPEKSTYGGKTIKKEISLNANLCKKDYIENTDASALMASCTGANKLLLAGPNAWAGTNWAICQDCTNAVTAGVINSCSSSGTGGGVDLADMNSNICIQLGGVYDPDQPGCTFKGQSFTDLISMIMTDIKELQVWQTDVNKIVNNIPSGIVDETAPSCSAIGAKYSLTVENGKIKLKCEDPVVCTGCAVWGQWTHSGTGNACVYKCSGKWYDDIFEGTRTTCTYTRSCITKSPLGCTGNVANVSNGPFTWLEGMGGKKYFNTSLGRKNASAAACPGASTFGL